MIFYCSLYIPRNLQTTIYSNCVIFCFPSCLFCSFSIGFAFISSSLFLIYNYTILVLKIKFSRSLFYSNKRRRHQTMWLAQYFSISSRLIWSTAPFISYEESEKKNSVRAISVVLYHLKSVDKCFTLTWIFNPFCS